MEKILIINVNWLGDVLLSTPVIKALRDNYPDSYIGCMIVPRVKEVLIDNPYLDEIIIYDEEGEHKGFLGKWKFVQQLKRKKFNKVYLLHRSFTRTFLCYLAGIPERIGYYTKKRGFLLTKKISQPEKNSLHRLDFYLNILKAEGIKRVNRDYTFIIKDQHRDYINNLLKSIGVKKEDLLIAVNPGANWKLKRWPEEYFVQLCDRLIEDFKAKVIITGSRKDSDLALRISSLMKSKPIDFTNKTNLKQLGALFEKVSVVITSDSGPMHIASAVGARLICLFGPTSPLITGPLRKGTARIIQKEVGCKIPCYNLNCKDNICMKSILPEEVLQEVKNLR